MDEANGDPLGLGLAWIRARLGHNPRTRHLRIEVSARGRTVILNGEAPCLADKQCAGAVAFASQAHGWLDNRIEVVDGAPVALSQPSDASTQGQKAA